MSGPPDVGDRPLQAAELVGQRAHARAVCAPRAPGARRRPTSSRAVELAGVAGGAEDHDALCHRRRPYFAALTAPLDSLAGHGRARPRRAPDHLRHRRRGEGLRAAAGFVKGWLESRDLEVDERRPRRPARSSWPRSARAPTGPTGHPPRPPRRRARARGPVRRPRIEGDRLIGRGAYDMKGALAAMMCALKDVADTGPRPRALRLRPRRGVRGRRPAARPTSSSTEGLHGDFALTGEPTDLHIGVQAKGVLAIRAADLAAPRPTARRPWLGDNAILKAHDAFRRIETLPFSRESSDLFDRPSINLARIVGGDAFNKVPDTLHDRRRHPLPAQPGPGRDPVPDPRDRRPRDRQVASRARRPSSRASNPYVLRAARRASAARSRATRCRSGATARRTRSRSSRRASPRSSSAPSAAATTARRSGCRSPRCGALSPGAGATSSRTCRCWLERQGTTARAARGRRRAGVSPPPADLPSTGRMSSFPDERPPRVASAGKRFAIGGRAGIMLLTAGDGRLRAALLRGQGPRSASSATRAPARRSPASRAPSTDVPRRQAADDPRPRLRPPLRRHQEGQPGALGHDHARPPGPAKEATAVMSIPRDLKVPIPGRRGHRHDEDQRRLLATAAPALAVKTVKRCSAAHPDQPRRQRELRRLPARPSTALGCVYVDVDRRYYHSNVGLPVSRAVRRDRRRPGLPEALRPRSRWTTCASATPTPTSCAPRASRTSCARPRTRSAARSAVRRPQGAAADLRGATPRPTASLELGHPAPAQARLSRLSAGHPIRRSRFPPVDIGPDAAIDQSRRRPPSARMQRVPARRGPPRLAPARPTETPKPRRPRSRPSAAQRQRARRRPGVIERPDRRARTSSRRPRRATV